MEHVITAYENYQEENRLTTNNARRIEFITTIKALEKYIFPGINMLDCAAGTGVYAFHYAEMGCNVTALDITPRHIEYINKKLEETSFTMATGINNATDLSEFNDYSFDMVLCMGPMYHLIDLSLREKCISECKRVLKQDGILVVAYINKYCVFPYVSTSDKRYLNMDLALTLIGTGTITHNDPNCFWTDSYYATPEEMENLLVNCDLKVLDHLATDGLSLFLKDKIDSMNHDEFEVWCNYHYLACRERSILGASNHGLVIGRK